MSNGNIEKLLDHLLTQNGELLVIGTEEPLFLLKAGRKIPLMNRSLQESEFNLIEEEFNRKFDGLPQFVYNDATIQTSKDGLRREFSRSDAGPGMLTAEPPPVPSPEIPPAPKDPEPPLPPPPGPPQAPPPQAPAPTSMSPPSTPPTTPSVTSTDPAPPAPRKPIDMDELLHLMVKEGASDLHLSSNCKPALRIDGDIAALDRYSPVYSDELLKALKTIAPERNIKEFLETHDTDFAYSIQGLARFRANIFRDLHGVGAVFRVIPSRILTVEDLRLPRAPVDLCNIPKGLILVTGPTGSGKSTTLAALINYINETQKKHIITIEDPVEFVHENNLSLVNQREIATHTTSFKRALRAALREDPDIILVGEMRDLETIAIAIEMAVTGHLVFGTLHTSTAIGTVDRVIDQFPADQQAQIRAMLADALIGVVAQTLLKKKEGGRIGAYEVLVVTPAVSNLIREGKNYQIATLMQTGKGLGMQTINGHLGELVQEGVVTPEEAVARSIDKENLKTLLRGKGIQVD